MSKIFEYFGRSLKIAWKSVFGSFGQYFCFFAAIIIIQVLFGTISISNDNNSNVEYQLIDEEYDYHVSLKNLNYDQMRVIVDDPYATFKSDKIYSVDRLEEYKNFVANEDRFDIYLSFVKDNDFSLNRLNQKYIPDLERLKTHDYSTFISPLVTFDTNIRANTVTFIFITLILFVLCIFLLNSLYNIRLNQYKFQYGVYLTFGADFKMLFGTAFWELFVIQAVTFIPSMGISTFISYMIFRSSGTGFVFNGLSILKLFLFTLAVIVIAIWAPMKLLSRKDPMSLIVTEDNSNLVTSPRKSVSIFGEKFPTRYEAYSIWRFRKYALQLLTTAIVFCAVFIMGLYMANIYTTDLNYPRPQFTIDLGSSGYEYDEEFSDEIYSVEGVKAVEISDNTTEAINLASHVIVDHSDVLPLSGVIKYSGTDFKESGTWNLTNQFIYTFMPDEQIRILEGYSYSGDLNSINKPGYVVIGDSASNIKRYSYEVGDKIFVAKKTGQIRAIDSSREGNNLLEDQIRYFRFEYYEYTIGAVIYDIPCGSTPIYFNPSDYLEITGKIPSAKRLSVYVEADLNNEQIKNIESSLGEWAQYYGDVVITNNDAALARNISVEKHYNELYVMASILVLLISPLVWFFSQTLYYKKREKEFNILQAIGAVSREIRSIYIQGGLTMATLSLVFSIILSYLGSYILFFIYNVIVPNITHENVRYVFYMPWYAIVTSVVLSVACGFFSAYFPYKSYFKHRYSLQNGGAGSEFSGE